MDKWRDSYNLVKNADIEEVDGEVSSKDSNDEEVEFGPATPDHLLARATSVNYAGRHSRQFSAGSARLLDVRRGSKHLTLDASAFLRRHEVSTESLLHPDRLRTRRASSTWCTPLLSGCSQTTM